MKWLWMMLAAILAGCSQQEQGELGREQEPSETPPAMDEGEAKLTNAPAQPPAPVATGVKQKDLEKRDTDGNVVGFLEEGLWFKRGEQEPFTGTVVGMYKNGQKESEKQYQAGKLEGMEVHWYDSGQKRWEIIHKDGAVVSRKAWSPDGDSQP